MAIEKVRFGTVGSIPRIHAIDTTDARTTVEGVIGNGYLNSVKAANNGLNVKDMAVVTSSDNVPRLYNVVNTGVNWGLAVTSQA